LPSTLNLPGFHCCLTEEPNFRVAAASGDAGITWKDFMAASGGFTASLLQLKFPINVDVFALFYFRSF